MPDPEGEQDNLKTPDASDPTPVDPQETDAPPYAEASGFFVSGGVIAWLRTHSVRTFPALRIRDYRLFFSALLLEVFGMWTRKIAAAWLVLTLPGGNVAWVGAFAAAQGLPMFFLLPVGGAYADRFDRRRLLMVTFTAHIALSIGMGALALTGRLAPWHLVAMAAAAGAINSFRMPANQSMLFAIVGARQLPNAVACNHVLVNVARIAGPAVAVGALMFGPELAFAVHAVLCSLAVMILAMIRTTTRPRHDGKSVLGGLIVSAQYLRSRGDLVVILLLVLISGVLVQPMFGDMLAALAKDGLNLDKQAFGTLSSSFGVGAMLGALLLARLGGETPTPWRAYPALAAVGAMLIALALVGSLQQAVVVVALGGVAFTAVRASLFTALHGGAPDAIRGRLSSLFSLSVIAGGSVGGLVAGVAAQVIGPTGGIERVYLTFGLLTLLSVSLLLSAARRRGVEYELAHIDPAESPSA